MTHDNTTDLGPCCVCTTDENVNNIIMLKKKAPIAGKGWGCIQCGLPMDGATVVLCDFCFWTYRARGEDILKYVCRGYPASDGRAPIQTLSDEPFEHDPNRHPELAPLN